MPIFLKNIWDKDLYMGMNISFVRILLIYCVIMRMSL